MAYIGTQPKDVRSFGRAKFDFTATQGQTAFTGADDDSKTLGFTNGQIEVYVNGILMDESDFTTSNGNTVTLASAANLNDVISIVAMQTDIPNSDYVPASGGTFSGNITASGTLGVTGAVTASNGLTVDDDGATPLTVDRATSDGTIIDVQKAGTSVGTVGSYLGTYLYMGSAGGTDTHINFVNGNVRPATATGAHLDNSLDLGHSQSRWKDIYLGGGAYIGGTAAANKLDDYEEGTFTPQVLNGWGVTSPTYSYNLGYYTKIGDLVYIRCQIVLSGGSINGNQLKIYGFPFTPRPLDVACTGYFSTASSNAENAFLQIVGSSTIFYFKYRTNTGVTDFNGTFAGSGFSFIMSGMYKTP